MTLTNTEADRRLRDRRTDAEVADADRPRTKKFQGPARRVQRAAIQTVLADGDDRTSG